MNETLHSGIRQYVLVLLKKAYASKNDIADLQNDHFNYLNTLTESGKLLFSGPLLDDHDIRAICIFNCSVSETIRLAQKDPAVLSGDLDFEIFRWLGPSSLANILLNTQALQLS